MHAHRETESEGVRSYRGGEWKLKLHVAMSANTTAPHARGVSEAQGVLIEMQ